MILLLISGAAAFALSFLLIRRYEFASIVNRIPGFRDSLFGSGCISAYGLLRIFFAESNASFQEQGIRFAHSCPLLYPSGLFRGWFGPMPHIVISSPEMVEPVLSSHAVTRKGYPHRFAEPWVGTGLVTGSGEKWKRHRKMLTPAFHFKILESFVPVMSRNGKLLSQKLDKESQENNGLIRNFQDIILNCTLDIICETAMGKSADAQADPDNSYVKSVHRVSDIIMDRIWKPWCYIDTIFNLTPLGRENKRLLKLIHSFTNSFIAARKPVVMQKVQQEKALLSSTGSGRLESIRESFIDSLIREHLKHPNVFTEVHVREEVDTFMVAGHDTTGWGVVWAVYLLGLHPDVQQRLQQEVDALYDQDPDSARDLSLEEVRTGLAFTEAVVKEAQRLYPSAPLIVRQTDSDIRINEYLIPAGVQIIINSYAIHRDKRHWKDPEKFDPNRFLGTQKRHPYSFIPFSAGPRNCVGQKYAMLEEKALIALIFRNFNVTSLDHRDKVLATASVVLKADVDVRLKLEKRLHSVRHPTRL